jgi:hypothetical protein
MGSLNEAVDLTLVRVHVIQPVVGADRVGVFGCPGPISRTGTRNARSARRALYLTSESGTSTQTPCKDGCADRNRELLPHFLPLFSHRHLVGGATAEGYGDPGA